MKIGIIGATGWLGAALGRGLLTKGLVAPGDLVLLNRSSPRTAYAHWPDVIWAADVADLVARAEAIVIAVRPEDWPALGLVAPDRLVVSLMATVPMAALAVTEGRLVRAMPNAAAELGRSYTPWLAGPDVTEADRAVVAALVTAIGTGDVVRTEAEIDLLTALSGSGAAFPALMAAAMLDVARAEGLPLKIAERAVASVIVDGSAMLAGRIGAAEALLTTYRDYRGTTAAALDAADAAGFRRAIAAGLLAATARASGAPR